jgi:hypothetical protein
MSRGAITRGRTEVPVVDLSSIAREELLAQIVDIVWEVADVGRRHEPAFAGHEHMMSPWAGPRRSFRKPVPAVTDVLASSVEPTFA